MFRAAYIICILHLFFVFGMLSSRLGYAAESSGEGETPGAKGQTSQCEELVEQNSRGLWFGQHIANGTIASPYRLRRYFAAKAGPSPQLIERKHQDALKHDVHANPLVVSDTQEEQPVPADIQAEVARARALLKKKRHVQFHTDKEFNFPQAMPHHISWRRENFVEVPFGNFSMNYPTAFINNHPISFQAYPIILTHTFEVAETFVTQAQWINIFGRNPSIFRMGVDSIRFRTNPSYNAPGGQEVSAKLDHPVEYITFWSALVYLNKLSEMYGYRPAYDLTRVQFDPRTSAAHGDLRAIGGYIFINAPNQDIYRTEGFRLMTKAEHDYIATDLGTSKTGFFYHGFQEDLSTFAWSAANSGVSTQPVALLYPLKLDTGDIYDIVGNVTHMLWDSVTFTSMLPINVDPTINRVLEHEPLEPRISLGGGWNHSNSSRFKGNVGMFEPYSTNSRSNTHGFRAVRTIR